MSSKHQACLCQWPEMLWPVPFRHSGTQVMEESPWNQLMNVHKRLQAYRDPGEDHNPLSFVLSRIHHAAHFSTYKYTKDSSERLPYCPYVQSYNSSLLLHITGINKWLTPGLHLPFFICVLHQLTSQGPNVYIWAHSDFICHFRQHLLS